MGEKDFVHGNDRLERMLERPGMADAVAALETEADELDRIHAMSLAMVREAGKRTQVEIAHELGISQGAVKKYAHHGCAALRGSVHLAEEEARA